MKKTDYNEETAQALHHGLNDEVMSEVIAHAKECNRTGKKNEAVLETYQNASSTPASFWSWKQKEITNSDGSPRLFFEKKYSF